MSMLLSLIFLRKARYSRRRSRSLAGMMWLSAYFVRVTQRDDSEVYLMNIDKFRKVRPIRCDLTTSDVSLILSDTAPFFCRGGTCLFVALLKNGLTVHCEIYIQERDLTNSLIQEAKKYYYHHKLSFPNQKDLYTAANELLHRTKQKVYSSQYSKDDYLINLPHASTIKYKKYIHH